MWTLSVNSNSYPIVPLFRYDQRTFWGSDESFSEFLSAVKFVWVVGSRIANALCVLLEESSVLYPKSAVLLGSMTPSGPNV